MADQTDAFMRDAREVNGRLPNKFTNTREREEYGNEESFRFRPEQDPKILAKKKSRSSPKVRRCLKMMTFIIPVVLGLILIATLIIVPRLNKTQTRKASNQRVLPEKCQLSEEAKNSGLDELIRKVEDGYSKFFSGFLVANPSTTEEKFRRYYKPFGSKPSEMKMVTDESFKLFHELDGLLKTIDQNKLKTRERKAIFEARHFLNHSFGVVYEGDYYAGDWMLAPNMFCWQPSCFIVTVLMSAVNFLVPRNLADVHQLIHIIHLHRSSISQYIENMKIGVQAGMVRSLEACRAGFLEYRSAFLPMVTKKEKGILDMMQSTEMLKPRFLRKLTPKMQQKWLHEHGENITSSLSRNLVEHVGKPIVSVLRYLEFDHLRHCPPSSVTSGLATLPLKHVYFDGVQDTSRPTVQRLPTGELLSGRKAFRSIMTALVTKEISPQELEKLGRENLDRFYAEAVSLAKNVTGESSDEQAIERFKQRMTASTMFFNERPFPAEESNDNAFLKCSNEKEAKKYCPKRSEAFSKWKDSVSKMQQVLETKLEPLFYTSGPKRVTPRCGLNVIPGFSPKFSFRGYWDSQIKNCSQGNSSQTMPFFLDGYGPMFSDYSVTAHEHLPGHHLEVQGYTELFKDKCGDSIAWLSDQSFFSGFSEGWATYAEDPLMDKDMHMYADDPMSKYGMLQQMIMGSLRLIIEPGLHYNGMTRSAALQLFSKYAWDESDLARKEITRYQSTIGQSATYMVGRNEIMKARQLAERTLGTKFSLKDFHYEVLHQGEAPLDYIRHHIDRYLKCKTKGQECDI